MPFRDLAGLLLGGFLLGQQFGYLGIVLLRLDIPGVPAELGEQPPELAPRQNVPEEIDEVDSELSVKISLDGPAVTIDQSYEAGEFPSCSSVSIERP